MSLNVRMKAHRSVVDSVAPSKSEEPQSTESKKKTEKLHSAGEEMPYHEYCVIGAGPGGLQIGYFLKRAGRDYVIFERSNMSGHFFKDYPRHRTLISINKRHTGMKNRLFNERHDWNSILSDNPDLLYRHYSQDFFPHADTMIHYLADYSKKLGLNIWYSANVTQVTKPDGPLTPFVLHIAPHQTISCGTVIVGTGMWMPNKPKFKGEEFVVGYEDISINPIDFEGKSVLILGRGNAAYETASAIYGSTNVIHMMGRSRVRLSWSTHYVGDLRAVNNALLDTYQLKSLDGMFEGPVSSVAIRRRSDGRLQASSRSLISEEQHQHYLKKENITLDPNDIPDLIVVPNKTDPNKTIAYRELIFDGRHHDNFALKSPYDVVIRCFGFKFDYSIFDRTVLPGKTPGRKKYPFIQHNYESQRTPGIFFVGTNTHSLDHRKSAGGFIHGFRYTARALHRLLEWSNHRVPWPHRRWDVRQLVNVILQRVNESPGLYQMFGVLCDVIVPSRNRQHFDYLQEVPLNLLPQLYNVTGHVVRDVIVVVLEYGVDFSGADKDTFNEQRATGQPEYAHTANFLHPVLYYYRRLPTQQQMNSKDQKQVLPLPHRLHHIVEDFQTDWTAPKSHILPLRRFVEFCIGIDLRHHYSDTCLMKQMVHLSMPSFCYQ